jgi:hypothetical protein
MSKKVVRLTESQLRLMINKVIQEQTAPSNGQTTNQPAPKDNTKHYSIAPLKMTKNDYIVKEILENISKKIFIFVSKLNPTQIITVNGDGLKPYKYNRNMAGDDRFTSKYDADHYQRKWDDVKSGLSFTVNYIQDSTFQRGERSFFVELYEDSIETALQKLNKNQGVISKFEISNDNTSDIDKLSRLFLRLYYGMGQNIKAAYDLISRAQPNILNNLRESLMSYAREQKVKEQQNEIYNYVRELDSITGKQQPNQQGQQPQK